MTFFLPNSAIALLAASATFSPSSSQASEGSLKVTIELTDETRKLPPLSLTLILSGDTGCSSLDDRSASGELHVQVCRERGEDRRPILSFHLDRSLHLDKATERRQVRTKLSMLAGKRWLIGRFGEGSTAMELFATVEAVTGRELGSEAKSP